MRKNNCRAQYMRGNVGLDIKLAFFQNMAYTYDMCAKITASKEDYLETIYDLSLVDEHVRSIDIATVLGVSRASVNKTLGILKESGFIKHEPYGTVLLTKKGQTIAKNVRLRHNALHMFLEEVLGVESKKAAAEACEMEHAISQETAQKLYEYLEKIGKSPGLDPLSKTHKVQSTYERSLK
nr:metal-dependent transcriptional regulator [Treponema phagedenis]